MNRKERRYVEKMNKEAKREATVKLNRSIREAEKIRDKKGEKDG